MYISYDHYRIFYYVAKQGSFTAAAEVLLNNQPNLTRAIKTLEGALGCELFVRSKKGVTLTPEGEALYAHVSIAFAHIEAAEEELAMNQGMQKGVLSIGASEIALRCFLLPVLNEYRVRYPNIRIKLTNVTTPEALRALKEGRVDLAVVTSPVTLSEDMSMRSLKHFEEIPICGDALREQLCGREVSLRELAELPIVSLGRMTSTYALYSKAFAEQGLSFSPDIEAATADQILPLVRSNLGIGFVPKDFLNGRFEADGVYPIRSAELLPERSVCLITRKSKPLRLPARELIAMI